MARARNIKPGLFKNEVLGVADPLYTLLFEGLWVLADREGRMEDRPLRIKAEVFPYREGLDINAMLDWLQENGFIRRYTSRGVRCIVVCEFKKHQNPHKNESESELPPPEDEVTASEKIGTTTESIGSAPADSLFSDSLNSDSLNNSPPASAPASRKAGDYTVEFEEAWSAYPQRPGNSKRDAFKAWSARLKGGAAADVMTAGVRRYAAYCEAEKTEPRFIKQAATFFGPGEHYLADWSPGKRPPPGGRHNGFDKTDYRKGIADDGTFGY